MRKVFGILVIATSFLFSAGCDISELSFDQSEQSIENSAVTAVEEITDTAYFHKGALYHILKGEINRNGQAVGYHYEGLPDADGEVVKGSASDPDAHGVYEAKVMVSGVEKKFNQGKSTFFPKSWDTQDVVDAINEAYENKVLIHGNTYEGLTDGGMTVRMYLDDSNNIISAFPQYDRR